MDVRTLECPICLDKYDESSHIPRILSCTHTCCTFCLDKMFKETGRIVCSICTTIIGFDDPTTFMINRQLMDMLDAVAIRCVVHDAPAHSFCGVHYMAVCKQCYHQGCELLNPKEDANKINFQVTAQITAMSAELDKVGLRLPQTLITSIRNVYTNKLRENVDTLQKLAASRESLHQLSCMKCPGRGQLTFNPKTMEVFCSNCLTLGGDLSEVYDVSNPTDARSALDWSIRGFMGQVNFCDLSLEILQSIAVRSNSSPIEMLQLANFLKNSILPKKEVQDLPNYCYCPQCQRLLDMSSDTIRLMPCSKALHAICENCATMLMGQSAVICPLDNFTFQMAVENLQWFNYQHYYAQQVAIPVIEPPKETKGGPRQEERKAPPGPPKNKHHEYPGTDLPAFALRSGQYLLDRFPSVLPAVDMPESRYTANSRGWNITADKNQVEAMIFTAFESIKLTGVGISNPVKPNVTATLTFIKIYAGTIARGAPAFTQTPNLPLPGGNNILTQYNFTSPFTVAAFTKYTIKLKIAPPQGSRELMMVYRGNPFERPETWTGTDNTVWEFEDTKELEAGEEINGQNNFTGPILRFFYTH